MCAFSGHHPDADDATPFICILFGWRSFVILRVISSITFAHRVKTFPPNLTWHSVPTDLRDLHRYHIAPDILGKKILWMGDLKYFVETIFTNDRLCYYSWCATKKINILILMDWKQTSKKWKYAPWRVGTIQYQCKVHIVHIHLYRGWPWGAGTGHVPSGRLYDFSPCPGLRGVSLLPALKGGCVTSIGRRTNVLLLVVILVSGYNWLPIEMPSWHLCQLQAE